MKTRKHPIYLALFVIIPTALGLITHFCFWYGQQFKPMQEWQQETL